MIAKLNPPQVETKIPAQYGNTIIIPFLMNYTVGMSDFDEIVLIIKSVQNDTLIGKFNTPKESIYYQENSCKITFSISSSLLQIGQYYKAQVAYVKNNIEGFYSKTMTFKYSSTPTNISIKDLDHSQRNIHKYTYTGVYQNSKDPNEKVYLYEFNLYNSANEIVATSGQLLHNSSTDTETDTSIDEWTVKLSLKQNQIYSLVYSVQTINGLTFSSPVYHILDNQTVPSDIFNYYDFIATPNIDSACVELSIQPNKNNEASGHKKVNGKFILLRASSEDNYDTWYEMTRFTLSSWDTGSDKVICKDYSVSQGVNYKYGIQVYNDHGIYSIRQESQVLTIDFEDIFLSDGDRQLRIRFNPKVSSIKNTILESKSDTLGGKYPFFFRNGNVKYKELSISGLISMLTDENEEFLKGIRQETKIRESTPSYQEVEGSLTNLTSENFRKEREFKHAVLEWLTNGKPKLFRSPGEGSFIVRLMNTSLTPNDTLSRMLHTFSCTAYEIDDFTFDNLRKYGMLMAESIETRDLQFYTLDLSSGSGHFYNLNAAMATVRGSYGTVFKYRLQNDSIAIACAIGSTGTYVFDSGVLKENPLMEIWCDDGTSVEGWSTNAKLDYAVYKTETQTSFSYINAISFNDITAQWVGENKEIINNLLDPDRIIKSIGLVYSLKVRKRLIVDVDARINEKFYKNNTVFTYGPTDIIRCDGILYDGKTNTPISGELDCTFSIYKNEPDKVIDLAGPGQNNSLTDPIVDGLVTYLNLPGLDYLYLGNGVYAEIFYQEVEREYTVETVDPVKTLKQIWKNTNTPVTFTAYYTALKKALEQQTGGLIINAL